jgi:hypothetical protein
MWSCAVQTSAMTFNVGCRRFLCHLMDLVMTLLVPPEAVAE